MRILVLGALEVHGRDACTVPLTSQQGLLISAMTVHVGEALTSDRLVEAVWERSAPRDPDHALHTLVSRLRKQLALAGDGEPCVVRRANGYVLELERSLIDALDFEDRSAAARQKVVERPEQASTELRDALGLWRGDAYIDAAYSSFAQPEIRRLTELRLLACHAAITAEIALGRAEAVIPELLALTERFPLREPLWILLLSALHATARTTEVAGTAERMRAILRAEHGVVPSPVFEALASELEGPPTNPLFAAQARGVALF